MRDVRTVMVVGGVVALLATGALAVSLARGAGDDTANGSVPVGELSQLTGSWIAVNDASAPARTLGVVRLEFLPDGQLVAQTGCNGLFATPSVEDSVLVAGRVRASRMACTPALMEQERWVTEMLDSRPRLELSGPYLYLHWGEGELWWLGLEHEPEGTHASIPAG